MTIGPRMNGWTSLPCAVLALVSLLSTSSLAATTYQVRLNTTPWTGLRARLAFDFTSSNAFTNTVNLYDFEHDGRIGMIETQGGLVSGDLLLDMNPAFFTQMQDEFVTSEPAFYTQLVLPFDSLGTSISFIVDLTEFSIGETQLFDEFAFYVVGIGDMHPFTTADPRGANALFSISINGVSGGDLGVFSPMQFVPPDTLKLSLPVVGVPVVTSPRQALRFRAAVPNPAAGAVRFDFDVSGVGGRVRLRIYDVTGRLVRELLDASRPAGAWSERWSGADETGRKLPAGIYLARLDLGGQSAVRKIVLAR